MLTIFKKHARVEIEFKPSNAKHKADNRHTRIGGIFVSKLQKFVQRLYAHVQSASLKAYRYFNHISLCICINSRFNLWAGYFAFKPANACSLSTSTQGAYHE